MSYFVNRTTPNITYISTVRTTIYTTILNIECFNSLTSPQTIISYYKQFFFILVIQPHFLHLYLYLNNLYTTNYAIKYSRYLINNN